MIRIRSAAVSALVALLSALVAQGCTDYYDDDSYGGGSYVCTENITGDTSFREIVALPAGTTSRRFGFEAFAGASFSAEVRIVDGSPAWSLSAVVRGASGAVVTSGAIAAPDLAFAFAPTADGMHSIAFTNAGASEVRIEVRGLAARGAFEDTAFGVNLHFAGPLLGMSAADVSRTALDIEEGIRAFAGAHGMAVSGVATYVYSTAELRAAGALLDAGGNAAIAVSGIDPRRTSCGAGTVLIDGLDELSRLARTDNDNIDIFLVGSIDGGIVGVSPRGGRLRGTEGAAVAVEMIRSDGKRRATALLVHVAVHEIGHFLSLGHTADYDASTDTFHDDGIADTPSAQTFLDRDGDGFPGVGEACPDESNVMFPRITGGCIFSAGQVAQMRAWLSLVAHGASGLAAPTLTADLAFDAIALPEAYADHAYQTGAATRGGTGPVTVSITAGALPGGLSLDAATGRISGIPTATGEFRLEMAATDATAATVTRTYLLEVRAGASAVFYLPRIVSRPEVGADVTVAPFTADGAARVFVISATGAEGRVLFDGPPSLGIDPLEGVVRVTTSTQGVIEIGGLEAYDVNRAEETVLFAVGE